MKSNTKLYKQGILIDLCCKHLKEVLLQVNKYNTHWRPYYIHCNICKLEFDVFAKFETLADDIKTIRGETQKLC